jgi:hypothetical protein
MFTEKDLFSYFDQIRKIEDRMYEIYQYLHAQLTIRNTSGYSVRWPKTKRLTID